jgi:hypothetical protein
MQARFLLCTMLFGYSSYSIATIVTVPNEKALTEELYKLPVHSFLYKTDILSKLADKELDASELEEKIETHISLFDQSFASTDPEKSVRDVKPQLLAAFFKNSPDALRELQEKVQKD